LKYYVPNMELVGTLKFVKQLDETAVGDESEVTFDFSHMSNFDPLPMLIMGSAMKNYRHRYPDIPFYIAGTNSADKGYAGTMGFFKYISKSLGIGKMPGEATGSSNYIPITPIVLDELQQEEFQQENYLALGDIIEKESGRLARIVDRGNPELHKLLTYLIREIIRNTPEHAKTDTVWVCGQYWPSYELAEIAIADEGIGIYNSIIQNPAHRSYITSNVLSLKWALKAGISEAFRPSVKQRSNDEWANSGFGLYMVSEICRHLNGSFCIISYGNYLLIDNHGVSEGETSYKGTAIRMRVPSKRISSAQEIINHIASQGENEARTIRNAFKKASTPSRGLMAELNID
jgi:hypothetical protein